MLTWAQLFKTDTVSLRDIKNVLDIKKNCHFLPKKSEELFTIFSTKFTTTDFVSTVTHNESLSPGLPLIIHLKIP